MASSTSSTAYCLLPSGSYDAGAITWFLLCTVRFRGRLSLRQKHIDSQMAFGKEPKARPRWLLCRRSIALPRCLRSLRTTKRRRCARIFDPFRPQDDAVAELPEPLPLPKELPPMSRQTSRGSARASFSPMPKDSEP